VRRQTITVTFPAAERHRPLAGTKLCLVSTILLPFFRCRFAVPVSRCRFRTPFPLPLRISMPNGKEFSYVIFIEQRNFTTAERRNGNERTATEWWKPGIMLLGDRVSWM